jgi:hypothetical protein
VRLAFSVMAQSDADVFLIDEVLAVGDAAFQQKCFDVFQRLRAEGKTIVLVTHAMELAARFCDRAMLLSGGAIKHIGDTDEVARLYLAENFASRQHVAFAQGDRPVVRLLDLHVEDEAGERVDVIPHGVYMRVCATLEAQEDLPTPGVAFWIDGEEQQRIVSFGAREEDGGALRDLRRGERVELVLELHNWLASGRHYVGCSVSRGTAGADVVLFLERAIDFHVWGGEALEGLTTVPHRFVAARDTSLEIGS